MNKIDLGIRIRLSNLKSVRIETTYTDGGKAFKLTSPSDEFGYIYIGDNLSYAIDQYEKDTRWSGHSRYAYYTYEEEIKKLWDKMPPF